MNPSDVKRVALRFNDCINGWDIDGLAGLMSDEHTFIDSMGNAEQGKAACLDAWRGFFEIFPDYQNIFIAVTVRDDLVIVVGYSTCSDERLDGPALWTARVRDGEVVEWRVYEDTAANRRELGIDEASGEMGSQ